MSMQMSMPQPMNAAVTSRTPRRALRWLGVLALLAGVVTAGVLAFLSTGAEGDAVKKFARAPVGCRTTLEFERSGTFTLFVETKGTIDDLGGDCEGNGESYDGDEPDDVNLTLTNDDGEVRLRRAGDLSYDTGDFVGVAERTVEIDDTGSYNLIVESDAEEFVVAIGQDPTSAASTMRLGAIIAGLGGLLLGGLLLVLGRGRKVTAVAAPAAYAPMPSGAAVFEPPYVGGPTPAAPPFVPGPPPTSSVPMPPPPPPPMPSAPPTAPPTAPPLPEAPSNWPN